MTIFYGVAALLLPPRKPGSTASEDFEENPDNLMDNSEKSVIENYPKQKESGTALSRAMGNDAHHKPFLIF